MADSEILIVAEIMYLGASLDKNLNFSPYTVGGTNLGGTNFVPPCTNFFFVET